MAHTADTRRLDVWLWYARFQKSRTLAAKLVAEGRVRINGERTAKPSHTVRAGDLLTFPAGNRIRLVRIVDLGNRRGPAPEARLLYEDLTPAAPPPGDAAAPLPAEERPRGAGRPTKRDRRDTDRLKNK